MAVKKQQLGFQQRAQAYTARQAATPSIGGAPIPPSAPSTKAPSGAPWSTTTTTAPSATTTAPRGAPWSATPTTPTPTPTATKGVGWYDPGQKAFVTAEGKVYPTNVSTFVPQGYVGLSAPPMLKAGESYYDPKIGGVITSEGKYYSSQKAFAPSGTTLVQADILKQRAIAGGTPIKVSVTGATPAIQRTSVKTPLGQSFKLTGTETAADIIYMSKTKVAPEGYKTPAGETITPLPEGYAGTLEGQMAITGAVVKEQKRQAIVTARQSEYRNWLSQKLSAGEVSLATPFVSVEKVAAGASPVQVQVRVKPGEVIPEVAKPPIPTVARAEYEGMLLGEVPKTKAQKETAKKAAWGAITRREGTTPTSLEQESFQNVLERQALGIQKSEKGIQKVQSAVYGLFGEEAPTGYSFQQPTFGKGVKQALIEPVAGLASITGIADYMVRSIAFRGTFKRGEERGLLYKFQEDIGPPERGTAQDIWGQVGTAVSPMVKSDGRWVVNPTGLVTQAILLGTAGLAALRVYKESVGGAKLITKGVKGDIVGESESRPYQATTYSQTFSDQPFEQAVMKPTTRLWYEEKLPWYKFGKTAQTTETITRTGEIIKTQVLGDITFKTFQGPQAETALFQKFVGGELAKSARGPLLQRIPIESTVTAMTKGAPEEYRWPETQNVVLQRGSQAVSRELESQPVGGTYFKGVSTQQSEATALTRATPQRVTATRMDVVSQYEAGTQFTEFGQPTKFTRSPIMETIDEWLRPTKVEVTDVPKIRPVYTSKNIPFHTELETMPKIIDAETGLISVPSTAKSIVRTGPIAKTAFEIYGRTDFVLRPFRAVPWYEKALGLGKVSETEFAGYMGEASLSSVTPPVAPEVTVPTVTLLSRLSDATKDVATYVGGVTKLLTKQKPVTVQVAPLQSLFTQVAVAPSIVTTASAVGFESMALPSGVVSGVLVAPTRQIGSVSTVYPMQGEQSIFAPITAPISRVAPVTRVEPEVRVATALDFKPIQVPQVVVGTATTQIGMPITVQIPEMRITPVTRTTQVMEPVVPTGGYVPIVPVEYTPPITPIVPVPIPIFGGMGFDFTERPHPRLARLRKYGYTADLMAVIKGEYTTIKPTKSLFTGQERRLIYIPGLETRKGKVSSVPKRGRRGMRMKKSNSLMPRLSLPKGSVM